MQSDSQISSLSKSSLTSNVILGLDISTSCTGWALVDTDGKLLDIGWFNISGLNGPHEKADFIESGLRGLPMPTHIFVEENVLGCRTGSSTAHTIVTLAKFNAVVSHTCWKVWNIAPVSIPAIRARSLVGLKVPKGQNAKEHVVKWAMERSPLELWQTRKMKSGKRKGEEVLVHGSVDAADAFLLATAGLKTIRQ